MGFWSTLGGAAGAVIGGAPGAALGYLGAGQASGEVNVRDALLGGIGRSPDPNNARYDDRAFIFQNAQQGMQAAQGRQAPQANYTQLRGGPNMGNVNASRDANMQLAGDLRAVASGQKQGAGEMAVNRGANTAIAQQQGAAMMSRGPMAGAGALTAARNTADIGTNAAGQASIAAGQDQASANNLLSQVLGQTRAQDIGVAQMEQQQIFQQAGLDQATSLANAQARLQTMGLNDQAALAYLAQITGMNQAEMAARIAQENTALQQPGILPGLLQAGGQVAGAAAMASDRNLKTDIKEAGRDIDELLSTIKPYAYRYTDEKHGKGERIGIMAQDLQRSKRGRELVTGLPGGEGLGVDVNKALSATLAGLARVNERLSAVEGRR
jgi:hypothetical protein